MPPTTAAVSRRARALAAAALASSPLLLWALYARLRRARVDWTREVVLITGGAQGVGEAFVRQLLATHNPRHVVILDVREPAMQHPKVAYFRCDVSDFEEVRRVGEHVMREIGNPTIVINNAGILAGKKFVDMDPLTIERYRGSR
ncbi:hypothetical protein HDU83_008167, partial [Entophlyctis luteolus]